MQTRTLIYTPADLKGMLKNNLKTKAYLQSKKSRSMTNRARAVINCYVY